MREESNLKPSPRKQSPQKMRGVREGRKKVSGMTSTYATSLLLPFPIQLIFCQPK